MYRCGGWLNNLFMPVAFASGAQPEMNAQLERRDEYEIEESKVKLESWEDKLETELVCHHLHLSAIILMMHGNAEEGDTLRTLKMHLAQELEKPREEIGYKPKGEPEYLQNVHKLHQPPTLL